MAKSIYLPLVLQAGIRAKVLCPPQSVPTRCELALPGSHLNVFRQRS
ncbi:hypothetical protein [Candidatus Vallotia cooleyia]|nr:hypothetical protein [Candidatus Vallotia cooleyia]